MTSETTSRAPRIERVPLGILYMVGATFMFSVSSAVDDLEVVEQDAFFLDGRRHR